MEFPLHIRGQMNVRGSAGLRHALYVETRPPLEMCVKSKRSGRTGVPPVNNPKIPLVPSIPLHFRFAKMFVMSGRPTHHPDAFLSESFRKPDSFGYTKRLRKKMRKGDPAGRPYIANIFANLKWRGLNPFLPKRRRPVNRHPRHRAPQSRLECGAGPAASTYHGHARNPAALRGHRLGTCGQPSSHTASAVSTTWVSTSSPVPFLAITLMPTTVTMKNAVSVVSE